MALIPLLLGLAIDDLLTGVTDWLLLSSGVFFVITLVGVVRRLYDTRAYGSMRVHLGRELARRISHLPVSKVNARLNMGRELVDFLEAHLPELLTALVQLVVSIIVLVSFDIRMGLSALVVMVLMAVVYGLFHHRFLRGNQQLNEQTEKQVSILEAKSPRAILSHLRALRRLEILISDTEALVYGLIFLLMSAFVLNNLIICAEIVDVTSGQIFSILSYSWAFVESAFMLPITLQQWTRLHEITERLNSLSADESEAVKR
ncbi:MAG: ABC-type bacteriocin/lantibiotic exporter with double-glycine peptidase domain [Oceanicoccus sp.]|jgi:ABC-type bacteriocin/lantibiotic exporter with double-glycine peptidase domain